MKRIITIVTLSLIAAPVAAGGLLNAGGLFKVAKIVLQGRSILGKGQAKCGSQLALAPQENLLVQLASAAVKSKLPIAQYTALDTSAEKSATTAAASPTFCKDTVAKKPGILGQIGKAAKDLGVGGSSKKTGIGDVLGGVLGGATTPK